MWCIWNSRNACLFERRNGEPYQISINAKALTSNLELFDISAPKNQDQKANICDPSLNQIIEATKGSNTENILQGAVIFSDASWKGEQATDAQGGKQTGLGIYIRNNTEDQFYSLQIQATTMQTSSAFQAEARELLLAAHLTQVLGIQQPIFLTDNQMLAKIAASRRLDHPMIQWNTRDTFANFFQATSAESVKIFHIKREFNEVANNCAKQVLRRSLQRPIYRCSSTAQSQLQCPVISILQQHNLQDFVIQTAYCS